MNFVEETIQRGTTQLPPKLTDAQSKYRAFLRLKTSDGHNSQARTFSGQKYSDYRIVAIDDIYKTVLSIPKMSTLFETQRKLHLKSKKFQDFFKKLFMPWHILLHNINYQAVLPI